MKIKFKDKDEEIIDNNQLFQEGQLDEKLYSRKKPKLLFFELIPYESKISNKYYINQLFIESYSKVYRYKYYLSKMYSENCLDFIMILKDHDLYGPFNALSYLYSVVLESKGSKENECSNLDNENSPLLPYPIDYTPSCKNNFFDHRNLDFIKNLVVSKYWNILIWSYVTSYDTELNKLKEKYVTEQASGFIKSYNTIVVKKIRVTKNLNEEQFEAFCKLHISIYSSIDLLTNIDQVFSDTIFHPLYLIYLNKYINFTHYYLRQNQNEEIEEKEYHPFEQVISFNIEPMFNPSIFSPKKQIKEESDKKPHRTGASKHQPSGSKVSHRIKRDKK